MKTVYELRRLNPGEVEALNAALKGAAQVTRANRPTVADLQRVYDDALQKRQTSEELNIVIGLALGALIVDGKEFEWARVIDDLGDETGIAVIGKMLHASPISMISTRLNRGERANLAELKDTTVKRLRERKAQVPDRQT
jgi:hypothetical protein